MVVVSLVWPINTWIFLISNPASKRWVAKLWRYVWHSAGLFIFASLAAFLTAFCSPLSSRWWRLIFLERGSVDLI